MATSMRVAAAFSILLSLPVARSQSALAQAEPVYLGVDEQLTARAEGLSGAFVALADDFGAGVSNPAGLTGVPRFFEGSLGFGTSVPLAEGLSFTRPSGVAQSPWGVALRHCAYTLGFSHSVPYEVAIDTVDGAEASAKLDTWNFFGAWQATTRLGFGLALNLGTFDADSTLGLATPNDDALAGFQNRAEDATSVTAGIGFDVTRRNRVALTYRTGKEWASPTGGDTSAFVALRTSSRLSVAATRRMALTDRLTLSPTVQLEWHDFSDGLDAFGGRLGAEVSFPIGRCWSGCGWLVHLRGGWTVNTTDAIVHLGALPSSLDAGGRVGFGGSLSFDTFTPMRVDVAARDHGDGLRWTIAFSARYGVSFRDVTRW